MKLIITTKFIHDNDQVKDLLDRNSKNLNFYNIEMNYWKFIRVKI